MTVPARVSVVTLGYRDRDRVRSFYEGLGWRALSDDHEFVRFDVGGGWLTLYPNHLLAAEAGLPEAEPTESFRGVTLAVAVEDRDMVDAAMDTVREAGGTVLAQPADREWGGRSAYFADPEGNVWEVVWLPGAAFDEGGRLLWPT